MGYWLQVEGDDSGKITDLTNNPYAYLEVTENRLYKSGENTLDF